MTLPSFTPNAGDIFGQGKATGSLSPGLDFAFGFTDENYIYDAKDRGWLICDNDQTSPAMWSKANELNIELNLEPAKGLKIQLTSNRTDNRTNQIQFMYDEMPITRTGSYTKTHCAIATALRGSSADDGYYSEAFNDFQNNIPVIANRLNNKYIGLNYPSTGFMKNNPHSLAIPLQL